MKVAYFDCFSGISGDMLLGSLVDLGLGIEGLKRELKKLDLSGYEIRVARAGRKGIWGTRLEAIVSGEQVRRGLNDILALIESSDLNGEVKRTSGEIFLRLAQAEAKVHNKEISELRFHELGATDAIVDVVGALIGIKLLGIEQVYASRLHLGTGFLECAHGILPVPAPATLGLLEGVPIRSMGIENELVTPTGAAIITTICKGFGEMPPMKLERVGYGVGSRDLSIPNVLRVLIGEGQVEHEEDRVILLETNIDDMNPQAYDWVMDLLFEKGARDVYLTPVQMKKSRPGTVLQVISPLDEVDELLEIIFRETTTLGVRVSEVRRRKLKRETRTINTRFGEVKVKVGFLNRKVRDVVPEYEECKRIAREHGLPIREVYRELEREVLKLEIAG